MLSSLVNYQAKLYPDLNCLNQFLKLEMRQLQHEQIKDISYYCQLPNNTFSSNWISPILANLQDQNRVQAILLCKFRQWSNREKKSSRTIRNQYFSFPISKIIIIQSPRGVRGPYSMSRSV
ncbi:unnamed protein product [Paramecium octaurelia]|uniref:Uncharacterized protein n=1 Tax=Paramecium octaurelia TaxID=43137 RepID=A0A8S1WH24_PAROT|nr:unnamed protein product [Paramecium octaurelia]